MAFGASADDVTVASERISGFLGGSNVPYHRNRVVPI